MRLRLMTLVALSLMSEQHLTDWATFSMNRRPEKIYLFEEPKDGRILVAEIQSGVSTLPLFTAEVISPGHLAALTTPNGCDACQHCLLIRTMLRTPLKGPVGTAQSQFATPAVSSPSATGRKLTNDDNRA